MDDPGNTLKQAVNSLENCEYLDARSAYRQATLLTCPTETVLDNLAIAEEGERREFRCTLLEKYPNSLIVLLDYVKRLCDVRNFSLAVHRCNELLQRSIWSSSEISDIRFRRLSAIVAGGSQTMSSQSALKEDVLFMLNYSLENGRRHAVVSWLAASLTSIRHAALIKPLAEIRGLLRDEMKDEYILKLIITSKLEELRYIEELGCFKEDVEGTGEEGGRDQRGSEPSL